MNVVELRRYALKPGRREDLIALFEREFVESQVACGITLIGYYRDLDDPDAFVWFRAFDTMEQRRQALEAFYGRSDAWARNRDAANATMLDSDNVLLLRPARTKSGFDRGAALPDSLVAVSVTMLQAPADEEYLDAFERTKLPHLEALAGCVAYFVTEPHANTFPRLPVREGEWAFVVTGECTGNESVEEWRRIVAATETLRLQPIGTSCPR
jgi:hypothetical protein